jgi:hypothetical protein
MSQRDVQRNPGAEDHIARAYHLNYDEHARKTDGEEGYFWRE